MPQAVPPIGQWFRRSNGALFEVVAVDEEDGTVDIQFFDGTIDEIELDTWPQLVMIEVSAPEDWSGSVDMDPEDYAGRASDEMPSGFHDPLDFLDRTN